MLGDDVKWLTTTLKVVRLRRAKNDVIGRFKLASWLSMSATRRLSFFRSALTSDESLGGERDEFRGLVPSLSS